jgi:hypothetical protein
MQGTSGISKPGTRGDSYVYFCSADPNQQGTVHLVKGQSVESFPRDLISTDQFTHGGAFDGEGSCPTLAPPLPTAVLGAFIT